MKKSGKLDWSLSAGKRPTVTNVASNIQIAQYKEPYLSQCSIYFEWYCPVCNEIHWAVEACCSYPAVNVHCLSIELTCSHTMVYMPWMKEGELKCPPRSKTSVYGNTLEQERKFTHEEFGHVANVERGEWK